jgi:hypothetical protein
VSSSAESEYQRRLAERRRQIADLERSHLRLSNLRLLIAAAGAAVLWLAFVRAALSPWWALLVWVVFGAVAVAHAKLLERTERIRRGERLYVRALERLAGRWPGTGRDGSAFAAGHPYAHDLDLFGRASLFELLNTARSEAGEAMLASWLANGADADEVRVRQQAIAELRPNLDLREALAVLASEGEVSRTGPLVRWAVSPPIGIADLWRVVLPACGAVTAALALLALLDVWSWAPFLYWILVESILIWRWKGTLLRVIGEIGRPADDLKILAGLASRVEREQFASPRLAALRTALAGSAQAIGRLERLVSLLESSTHNLFAAPITQALLVPQQLAMAIDRWHAVHGGEVDGWLSAIGEVESLCALATYAYEHDGDPFPAIAGEVVFDAEALAHPLLRADTAVANDVRIGGSGPRVIVVSGSNMSGKSTLLRAIGVNIVLALAGAPVRAKRLTLARFAIGATLRVDDSLEEGHSKFYSEILRIRAIVDAAKRSAPLLFLLDEILHGTNSYDRRVGAEAIVRALVDAGAIGLVTTHDLALTELPARFDGRAVNMHFEDRLENGRMVFDYRMRPGVVEHSNALALMRAIGLDV